MKNRGSPTADTKHDGFQMDLLEDLGLFILLPKATVFCRKDHFGGTLDVEGCAFLCR